MKAFFTFIFIVLLLGGLYYGAIYFVKKGFNTNPKADVSETTAAWQEQKDRTQDLQDRQRELMRQRQDRMRDLQHR